MELYVKVTEMSSLHEQEAVIFNIIHCMHCVCNHLYILTFLHKLHKMKITLKMQTLLYVSVINHHTQGMSLEMKYNINTSVLHVQC